MDTYKKLTLADIAEGRPDTKFLSWCKQSFSNVCINEGTFSLEDLYEHCPAKWVEDVRRLFPTYYLVHGMVLRDKKNGEEFHISSYPGLKIKGIKVTEGLWIIISDNRIKGVLKQGSPISAFSDWFFKKIGSSSSELEIVRIKRNC